MSDLISRQAVLDIIHRFFTEEVDKIPTKKTEDGEVYVIHKCQPLFEMNKAICKRIKALPSVTPTQNCVGNALDMRCEDAISRDTVLDAIEELKKIHFDRVVVLNKVRDRVLELQSVNPQEPKTGHWESTELFYEGESRGAIIKCIECGNEFKVSPKVFERLYDNERFCNYCGCRMVEPQESEVNNG